MSVATGQAKSMAVLVKKESEESLDDLEDTRRTIECAETRARVGRKKSEHKFPQRSDREIAEHLHREADQLYHSGDYETALVLYHRAANVYPRDNSHGVAVRRTAATISSWNNPTKAQRKLLPNAGDQARLAASVCPEAAAVRASNALKISPTAASVSEVLSYFDNHKEFWQNLPSPRGKNDKLAQSRAMLKQLNGLATLTLKNLEATFTSGKITAALKIAQELLTLSTGLPDPRHHQIAAYHYLSLIHVALGRHDRASSSVSRMIRLSKSTGNAILFCRSLVTLGKVHLAFGHLEAAARAWNHLSHDLTEPIPLAWLYHEIGRCHVETGKHANSLEMAMRCVKIAQEAGSKKWVLYGNLLVGQALAKLGRFAESLEQLKLVSKITKEEGDTPMLSYVQDLVDQVTVALRKIVFDDSGHWRNSQTNILNSAHIRKDEVPVGLASACKGDSLMTTVFSRTQGVEIHNGTSSSEEFLDAAGEITTRSMETRSTGPLSYREGKDEILQGNTTFRIRSRSQSSRSSSDDSVQEMESTRTKVLAVESSEFGSVGTSFEDRQEVESCLARSSNASIKSAGTNATYVVKQDAEKPEEPKETRKQENASKDRTKRNERGFDEATAEGMQMFLEKYNMYEVLEEVDKKDDGELVEILKKLLIDEENNEAFKDTLSKGSENASGSRRTRSCQDSYHKVLGNRSLFRHSLPSSPRE